MERFRKIMNSLGFLRGAKTRGPLRTDADSTWPKFTEMSAKLFRDHGVEAIVEGERIVFPRHAAWAAVTFWRAGEFAAGVNVRTTVRFGLDSGPEIVECFAGPGKTDEEGAIHGFGTFIQGNLHVMLATFFQPADEQVTEQEWLVGGRPRRVVLGNAVVKKMGETPAEPGKLLEFFPQAENAIRAADLPAGIHWVRMFVAQLDGKLIAVETLLDNEPWDELREIVAAADWPCDRDYYSVRLFLTIRDP